MANTSWKLHTAFYFSLLAYFASGIVSAAFNYSVDEERTELTHDTMTGRFLFLPREAAG
jgi:hypothetical protein